MDWGGPEFVVALIAISTVGWLVNNWIRARHGYALEDEWGGKTNRAESDEAARLKSENAALRQHAEAVQDRLVAIERIVTDRGYSLHDEIEALRERGVAVGTANKETR